MGKGNCNVAPYEGMIYIPWDRINLYTNKNNSEECKYDFEIPTEQESEYEYDEILSQKHFNEIRDHFTKRMMKKFKSLTPADYWKGRSRHIILENKLFMIALEDNEWSLAIELLWKPSPAPKGLQKQLFPNFFKGVKDCLFTEFDTLYVRAGTWTSRTITKESETKEKETPLQQITTVPDDTQTDSKETEPCN